MSGTTIGSGGAQLATWTTSGRPASPVAGQLGWNTTLNGLDFYNGSSWNSLANTFADSNGDLGLGVTPSAWGSGSNLEMANNKYLSWAGAGNILQNAYFNGTNYIYKVNGYSLSYVLSAGQHQWYNAPSGTAGGTITYTQAMTLDNSGNLNVGQTSGGLQNSNSFSLGIDGNGFRVSHASGSSSGSVYCNFGYNGSSIGSITQSGTSGVLYNITSDRRLKSNITSITSADSGPIIDALLPRKFTWNADGSTSMGFITDEYQNQFPNAITGQPNATTTEEYEVTPAIKDEQGNITTPAVMGTRTVPVYQMGDFSTSEFMAVLVAEIQSLRARLKAANIA